MRLFHVSEEPDIRAFIPRLPTRKDLDPATALVWAIDEARLPNFLTPRNCPRVAWHVGSGTTDADRMRFFSSAAHSHALAIESIWAEALSHTALYLYEFDPTDFLLQDDIAGYYVSKKEQIPIAMHRIDDPWSELTRRNVEIRVVDSLWEIADAVQSSTLNWSLCRMAFAQPRR